MTVLKVRSWGEGDNDVLTLSHCPENLVAVTKKALTNYISTEENK